MDVENVPDWELPPGPAELHEAGECDAETCDWCGEEEERNGH